MSEVDETRYWDGTVVCPRKGLTHISHKRCLEMYDENLCGRCNNQQQILEIQMQEAFEEEERRAERKALASEKKRGPK